MSNKKRSDDSRRDQPPEQWSDKERTKHPRWRRQTQSYRARKRYVRDLWIYSGVLIIFMPLSMQVFCLAALSFLSLSILDGEYRPDHEGE